MVKIVVVAGDKSGDIYGGLLCKKIKEKFSQVQIFSFGGSRLSQHSRQVINLLDVSVSGIFEVFSSLFNIIRNYKETIEEIDNIKPDLVILIDFPDFNLRLAKELNNRYHLLYYVSPQVWAWRKKRIEVIKKYVNKMVVIFRFEENFYRDHGMTTLYFGHPLLDIVTKKNVETKKIISFMPGSRKNEIKNHLPVMIESKKILEKDFPDHHFRIIRPENIEKDFYSKFTNSIEIIEHSYGAIEESEFIITASGTATVELAILEVPFLIIYKLNNLTWHILKNMVNIKFIGMVNILSGKKVVEELIQKEATAKNIADQTWFLLKDRIKYRNLKNELKKIKETLSPYGATDKFSDYIGKFLGLSPR